MSRGEKLRQLTHAFVRAREALNSITYAHDALDIDSALDPIAVAVCACGDAVQAIKDRIQAIEEAGAE
jgi:hypothetical protein